MYKTIFLLLVSVLILGTAMAQSTINVPSAISSFISSAFSDLSPAQQSSLINALGRATTVSTTVTVLPTSQLSSLANSILSTLTSSTSTGTESSSTETTSNAAIKALAGNGMTGVAIAVVLGMLAVLAL